MIDVQSDAYKILIVDDHPIVRLGMSQMIDGEPGLSVCGEAATIADAIRLVEETGPDLVVVDLTLEDGNGLELIKQLKSQHPNIRTLVTSMHQEELYAERSLRAGALGYIEKDQGIENLLVAVRQVLEGKVYLSESATNRFLRRMVQGEDPVARPPVETLSDRELEVFQMIGRGMGSRQIAQKLNLSIKTVETYRDHIKSKFGLKTSTELAVHAAAWVLKQVE